MEEWKDVIGYEGFYQVSNMGRVKSLERIVKHSIGGDKLVNERILKPGVVNGYYQVSLSKNGNHKICKIHQLVVVSFLNHIPNGHTIVIDHVDGNKLNNKLTNLHLVTNRENSTTCFRKDKDKHSSQYVGVNWHKSCNKWKSQIQINGKRKHLGLFNTELEASNAYQNKLKEISILNE